MSRNIAEVQHKCSKSMAEVQQKCHMNMVGVRKRLSEVRQTFSSAQVQQKCSESAPENVAEEQRCLCPTAWLFISMVVHRVALTHQRQPPRVKVRNGKGVHVPQHGFPLQRWSIDTQFTSLACFYTSQIGGTVDLIDLTADLTDLTDLTWLDRLDRPDLLFHRSNRSNRSNLARSVRSARSVVPPI